MFEKFQLKGGISEVNFGYNVKMEGYTNSSSEGDILLGRFFRLRRSL